MLEPRRIGLVGCVKSKLDKPISARDLYTSPLFRGRRKYVERTCDRWFVLSAKHGLVDPDTVLEPYDQTLKNSGRAERRRWGAEVLYALKLELGAFSSTVFEIHAGDDYRAFGLVDGIRELGGQVTLPTEGLSLGQQLEFYRARDWTK
ncbi:MAG TPA: hypothetical protein VFH00_09110 [Candidatus Nitrosotalea sp.]|nr:hypothetical protein [Candidatus Nitrosotalea sp.]